jgi:hypothetical protein
VFGSPALVDRWHAEYNSAKDELNGQRPLVRPDDRWRAACALLSVVIAGILLSPVVKGTLSLGLYFAIVNAVSGWCSPSAGHWSIRQTMTRAGVFPRPHGFDALEETPDAIEPPGPAPTFDHSNSARFPLRIPGPIASSWSACGFTPEQAGISRWSGQRRGQNHGHQVAHRMYPEYDGRSAQTDGAPHLYRTGAKAFFSVCFQDFARYGIRSRKT